MAVAFQFARPVFDEGKWRSRGVVYKIEEVNGVPSYVPADGFNPLDLTVPSSNYETVKQAWINVVQQVESSMSAEWAALAATDPPQKFGANGAAL
jgi:post-segregation antitoxin (ccd killing protein)